MKPEEQAQEIKICPKCMHEFTCITEEGCWCEKLNISKENLAYLRTKYIDCLCPKCLEAFAEKSKMYHS